MYSIGIDIGGMSAKLGLIQNNKIEAETTLPTSENLDYEQFVEELGKSILALGNGFSVEKIGISSCGLVNSSSGAIVYSNNIKWKNKSIVSDLAKQTNLPVRIANDAKCAAFAEAVYGAGRGFERVCMITLGTGVGGGFVCNKRLDSGNPYCDADGILGHITVERNGRQCTCGRKGCLEAYSSATAVMSRYQEKTGQNLTAKEIFENARAGEVPAKETIEEFTYYLGEGLVSLVNVLRPEIIVLGGGVAKAADMFIPNLTETVNRQAYGGSVLPVKFAVAELGNTAGMIGASLL